MQRFLLLLTAALLFACGEDRNAGGNPAATSNPAPAPPKMAISLWEQAGLRDKPGRDKSAKVLASINFGEKVLLTGNRALDSADKDRPYVEVELADGKKGWTAENLLALDARRAVALDNLAIYRRPDLTTVSSDNVPKGALIALQLGEKEGWVEFAGREKKLKGWIQGDSRFSEDEVDVTVAIQLERALKEKDPDKQEALLAQIENNPTLRQSPLISLITEMRSKAEALPELPSYQLYITANAVNVRLTPDNESATNVVFQLKYGDVCTILERGDRVQIREMDDYWYKIEFEGKEGWVYGYFTSRKLEEAPSSN
jgi:uncharacterized protein YgiM (DUF1202 family)